VANQNFHSSLFIWSDRFKMPGNFNQDDSGMAWIEAASVSDFEGTDRKYCEVDGDRQVAVFLHGDGNYYAVEAWCSHQKVSLMNGDLDDYELMCPLHGACFDVRTGKHLSLPAVKPIASYPVKLEGDRVLIEVADA